MGEGNQTLLLINEKTEKEQLSFMYMGEGNQTLLRIQYRTGMWKGTVVFSRLGKNQLSFFLGGGWLQLFLKYSFYLPQLEEEPAVLKQRGKIKLFFTYVVAEWHKCFFTAEEKVVLL